jgi:hypothetical protein
MILRIKAGERHFSFAYKQKVAEIMGLSFTPTKLKIRKDSSQLLGVGKKI